MENTTDKLRQGDKVKNHDNPDWEQPYARAIVTSNPEGEEVEIMPLEGKAKGEPQVKDESEISDLKQKTWLCMVGTSYGVSESKQGAVRNALKHFEVREDADEISLWLAEVDKTNWEIRGMGQVYSTFIENDHEIEISPDLAREIGDRADDTTSLVYSALDGAEPYREGLNYQVNERRF